MTTWMKPENSKLSEVVQAQKEKCHVIPLIQVCRKNRVKRHSYLDAKETEIMQFFSMNYLKILQMWKSTHGRA